MNSKKLTSLAIILCVFFMLRMGLIPFIDVPILSFVCGLLVPIFGWKRIMVIRLGLVALALITNPPLLYSLYALSEGLELDKAFLGKTFLIFFFAIVFGQALLLVPWFYKRYKKYSIY